jgi:integrase
VPGEQRRDATQTAGEAEEYLGPDARMDHAFVCTLGDALQHFYNQGKLYAEFGAGTGLRQSELFAVTAENIDLLRRLVAVDWQVSSKGKKRLDRPKGGKTRTAIWHEEVSGSGYDLAAALTDRVAEVRGEQALGRNPLGLIFPAPRGGWWDESNFDERVWSAAAKAISMESVIRVRTVKKNKKLTEIKVTHWKFTSHSLRDRFAVTALDEWKLPVGTVQIVGGWATSDVLIKRYYGATSSAL